MGRKCSSTIQEVESLAEEIRKFPCIYDKSCADCKEKQKNLNAWKAVEERLGVEEGEASKQFDNLKKRYSKKRNLLKSAKRSGVGREDIESFEKELKKYDFLDWLKPYIRLRQNTSTNISDSDESFTEENSQIPHSFKPESDGESDTSDKESVKSFASTSQSGQARPRLEKVAKKQAPQKVRANKKPKSIVDETESECLKAITERLVNKQNPIEKNEDDLFGEMVAAELKTMPKRIKFRLKHEINNAIYKFQEMNMESEMRSFTQTITRPNAAYNAYTAIQNNLTTPPGNVNAVDSNRLMSSFQPSIMGDCLNLPYGQWDGNNK